MKRILYYLNYKNLFEDIRHYGFVYSWKKLALSYVAALFTAVCIGVLFKLDAVQIMVILVFAGLSLPALIVNGYNSSYQQRRFSDVNQYVEQMLYYFKANNYLILNALEEIQKLFPAGGPMRLAIEQGFLLARQTTGEIPREAALKPVEEEYPCDRIRKLHKFMISVNRTGGECDESIEMLLKDRNLWANRILSMQKEKRRIKNNILFSIIMSCILCLLILYMPEMIKTDSLQIGISHIGFVKWSAVLFIILMFCIYIAADKKLCIDWLENADNTTEEEAAKLYYRVVNYDAPKEFLYSIIWAVVPLVIAVIAFILTGKSWVLLAGIAGVLFMLNQHKVGHSLSKKKLLREIEKTYPVWLMDVSLLLQTENVRQSIRKSYEHTPYILKPALAELIQNLENDPVSPAPYEAMLGEFDLPEVRASMGTLYSICTGAGGDVTAQFGQIIERTIAMTDRAEKLKNEDRLAVFNGYIAIPAVLGGLKLLIDMTALLIAFFSISFV